MLPYQTIINRMDITISRFFQNYYVHAYYTLDD